MIFKMTYPIRKVLTFIFVVSCFNLFAQMPASYGTSGATNNINSEVISRFLFGSGNIAAPFSWSPVIPSGGTDITNPNSTGNNILPCRGYSDHTLGNNNPSDGNPTNSEHMAIVERGQMYSMQIVGQRCSGSGWGVPFNTQRGVKVFIDFNQDGVFNPNTENVLPLAFQGTGTGWTPTYNVFNVMIPATALTGTTHMRVVYSRLGTVPFFTWYQIMPQGMYSYGETQDYTIEISGLIDSLNITNINCNGVNNGIIEVVPHATAPVGLEYSISGMLGPFQSSPIFTGLSPGIGYDIWVRDPSTGELEEYNANTVFLTEPNAINFTPTVTSNYNGSQISCFGATDGEITVSVSGGIPPYDYSIDNGATFVSTALSPHTITNISDGTYDIYIQDANGCTAGPISLALTEPDPVTANTLVTSNYNGQDVSCTGASDGQITMIGLGGTAPYLFDFDNSGLSTNAIINNLSSGTYDMTIEDANGCTNSYTGAATLTDPPILVIGGVSVTSNYNGEDISCNGASDGIIEIIASGGTSNAGEYTYFLDNIGFGSGPSPYLVTNLNDNTYGVVVQDDNGCVTASTQITLTEPPLLSIINAFVSSGISCNGLTDGEITIDAQGGTGAYQYSIDNGQSYLLSSVFGSLPENSYNCYVIDDNGCIAGPSTVDLIEPSVLVLNSAAVTSNFNGMQTSCDGSSDGEITILASGGTPNYNYSVTGSAPFFPSNVVSGLQAGNYDVVVQDANGCETNAAAMILNITSPAAISASTIVTSDYNGEDISCNGYSDGEITITTTGGTGSAYTYMLDAANYNGASPYSVSALSAGLYSITVLDANGCTFSIPATIITEPTPLSLSTSQLDAGCNGAADGSALVTPTGATPSYNYLWNTGETTANISALVAGSYSVTVTDQNGCTESISIDILQPQISTEVTDITCFGAANGIIDVIITNGNNSYSYSWNDPASQNTSTASNLATGVYTVTATDVFGCELIATDSVTQPEELIVNILSSTLCSSTDIAKVEVEVDGGFMPYQFLWNTTDVTSVIYVVDGNYSIDVTDANSCVTTQSVVVEPYYPITITYQTSSASCIDNNDGLIVVAASGGYTPYTYDWSNGALDSIVNVSSGEYTLTIIDNEGCEESATMSVSADQATCLEVYSAFSPNGDQNNDYWYIGNIELYPDALVEVFNRWGDRVFAAKNYTNAWSSAWNGNYEEKPLPSATYYYVITLNNGESPYKGNVTIVR